MLNIEVGKTYYFNNRPILILRKETEDMFLVCGDFNIDHDVTGSCFCTQCQVGGSGYLGAHTCDDVDYAIEAIMEDISDKNIFWVAKSYIQETPFEFKENTTLKDENIKLRGELNRLKSDIDNANTELDELQCKCIKLSGSKVGREIEIENLVKEIERLEKDRDYLIQNKLNNDILKIGNIELSTKELLSLLEDRVKLNLLEVGGVDNWEWYGESIGNTDIENEALNELLNLQNKC